MRAAEAFKRAREADLPALWAATQKPLTQLGSRLASSWCPCCGDSKRKDKVSLSKEDGIWRWRCFACQQGGTAIDLIARIEGIDPIKAAEKIMGGSLPTQAVPGAEKAQRKTDDKAKIRAFAECIEAMRQHGIDPMVQAYLGSRGIRPATLERAHHSGLLITLPADPAEATAWLGARVGRSRMVEAGLWSKRWPAAAFRPMIFAGPTSEVAEFRTLGPIEGSPKAIQFGRQDYPLLFKPKGEVKRVVIVEGGVDLLSLIDMGEDAETLLVGLYGTGSWREAWAKRIAAKYAKAEWRIATDADEDGERCAAKILKHLGVIGVPASRWRPFVGKDWNDALKSIAA